MMSKKMLAGPWKPGIVDFVILAGAVVNAVAILAIVAYWFQI